MEPPLPLLPPSITHYLTHLPEIPLTNLPQDQQTCPVCLEPFASTTTPNSTTGETPLRLRCGHVFGSDCLHAWVYSSPKYISSPSSSPFSPPTSSSYPSSSSSATPSPYPPSTPAPPSPSPSTPPSPTPPATATSSSINPNVNPTTEKDNKVKIITHRPTCPLCRASIKPPRSIERWELFIMLTLLQPPPPPPDPDTDPPALIVPSIHLLFTVVRQIAFYHRRHNLPFSPLLLRGAEAVAGRMGGLVGVCNVEEKDGGVRMRIPWGVNGPGLEDVLETEVEGGREGGEEKEGRFERAFEMLEGLERERGG